MDYIKRVLFEKLMFSTFCGTRRISNVFARDCHWSEFWTK